MLKTYIQYPDNNMLAFEVISMFIRVPFQVKVVAEITRLHQESGSLAMYILRDSQKYKNGMQRNTWFANK
jgi:hypothetical protein